MLLASIEAEGEYVETSAVKRVTNAHKKDGRIEKCSACFECESLRYEGGQPSAFPIETEEQDRIQSFSH